MAAWNSGAVDDEFAICTRRRLGERGKRTSVAVALLVAVFGTAATAPGCKNHDAAGKTDDTNKLAQDGAEAHAVETNNELLTSSLLAPSAGGSLSLASAAELSGDLSVSDVGDGAKALYFPRGCLTVTADETNRTVDYVFSQCTGPNGLFKITGEVKATYAVSAGTLVLDLVGTQLKVNRALVDWSAHAEVSASGAARTMRWKAQISGETPRGRTLTRSNEKTLSWRLGERCLAISGSSDGTVGEHTLRTDIADLERCQGSCPEAGGRITVTNTTSGQKIDILFDGTAEAKLVDATGAEATFALTCD